MAESRTQQDKASQKREYNRKAQKAFRQRRKDHLIKIELAAYEANLHQNECLEQLRRENQALHQENEVLKANNGFVPEFCGRFHAVGKANRLLSYQLEQFPPTYLEATSSSLAPAGSGNSTELCADSRIMPVHVNILAVRQNLHDLLAPVLEVAARSKPQDHLAALKAIHGSLPPPLQPTALQLSTSHHAYIDMIPSPSLRDRLIMSGPTIAGVFLMEVCTITSDIEDTDQMTLWGPDWLDELSWEFSAAVLDRWGQWLLTSEWIERANFWRRHRGAQML